MGLIHSLPFFFKSLLNAKSAGSKRLSTIDAENMRINCSHLLATWKVCRAQCLSSQSIETQGKWASKIDLCLPSWSYAMYLSAISKSAIHGRLT